MTHVDTITGSDWMSEKHSNTVTRYFNGRKYTVLVGHNFMTAFPPSPESRMGTLYWMQFTQYVTLANEWSRASSSFRTRSIPTPGPSVLQRTIDNMVPDDMQAVPF